METLGCCNGYFRANIWFCVFMLLWLFQKDVKTWRIFCEDLKSKFGTTNLLEAASAVIDKICVLNDTPICVHVVLFPSVSLFSVVL